MAWCRQAPSHYLSQCWLRSKLPCGVTRPLYQVISFTILPPRLFSAVRFYGTPKACGHPNASFRYQGNLTNTKWYLFVCIFISPGEFLPSVYRMQSFNHNVPFPWNQKHSCWGVFIYLTRYVLILFSRKHKTYLHLIYFPTLKWVSYFVESLLWKIGCSTWHTFNTTADCPATQRTRASAVIILTIFTRIFEPQQFK